MTKEKIDSDTLEREKRRCNIIIREIGESKATLISDKIEEDRRRAIEILNIQDKEILNVRRAGRSRVDGSIRPLILTVSTPELANDLHNYGRGQKRVNDLGTFWINPDLIQADRVANYKVRVLARQKRNALKEKEIITNTFNTPNRSIQITQNHSSRPVTARRGLPAIPIQHRQTDASPLIFDLQKKH